MGAIGRYIDLLPDYAKDRLVTADNFKASTLYSDLDGHPGGCLRGYAEGFVENQGGEPTLDGHPDMVVGQMIYDAAGGSRGEAAHFLYPIVTRFNKGIETRREKLTRAIKLRAAAGISSTYERPAQTLVETR
jgi:hypothetical protein